MKPDRPPLLCWLRLHRWKRQAYTDHYGRLAIWDECQRCYRTRNG